MRFSTAYTPAFLYISSLWNASFACNSLSSCGNKNIREILASGEATQTAELRAHAARVRLCDIMYGFDTDRHGSTHGTFIARMPSQLHQFTQENTTSTCGQYYLGTCVCVNLHLRCGTNRPSALNFLVSVMPKFRAIRALCFVLGRRAKRTLDSSLQGDSFCCCC